MRTSLPKMISTCSLHPKAHRPIRNNCWLGLTKKCSTDLESHSYIIKVIIEYIQCPNEWPDKDPVAQQSLIDPPDEGKKRKMKTGWDLSDKPIKKLQLESQ